MSMHLLMTMTHFAAGIIIERVNIEEQAASVYGARLNFDMAFDNGTRGAVLSTAGRRAIDDKSHGANDKRDGAYLRGR